MQRDAEGEVDGRAPSPSFPAGAVAFDTPPEAPPTADAPPWKPIARPDAPWHTARFFVSSTLRDMHGERSALTQRVFPALRRLCRQAVCPSDRRLHTN